VDAVRVLAFRISNWQVIGGSALAWAATDGMGERLEQFVTLRQEQKVTFDATIRQAQKSPRGAGFLFEGVGASYAMSLS
jgi:hypothetical protein